MFWWDRCVQLNTRASSPSPSAYLGRRGAGGGGNALRRCAAAAARIACVGQPVLPIEAYREPEGPLLRAQQQPVQQRDIVPPKPGGAESRRQLHARPRAHPTSKGLRSHLGVLDAEFAPGKGHADGLPLQHRRRERRRRNDVAAGEGAGTYAGAQVIVGLGCLCAVPLASAHHRHCARVSEPSKCQHRRASPRSAARRWAPGAQEILTHTRVEAPLMPPRVQSLTS